MDAYPLSREVFDTPIPRGLFAPHPVTGMPDWVDQNPHEFFEQVRAREGDLLPIREGGIDGIPMPFFASKDPARPAFVVVGFETIEKVVLDHETYAQDYVEHMEILMGKHVLGALNGPKHRKYRGLVRQAFGPEAVAQLGDQVVKPLVEGLVDRILAKHRADLVPDLAEPLPVLLIGHIFDLPVEQYGQFASLAARLLAAGFDWEDAMQASLELEALFRGLIEERRRSPGEDIISRLILARLDGEQLDDDDIISFCRALLPAGMETTSRALSSMMAVLLTHRSNWEALLKDRSHVPAAIEELLRWNAPAQAIPKRPTRDVEIGGRKVPAGASFWVYTGHGNRDPRHWERPHEYDLTRPRARHLAFSLGPHMCLGMGVARVELEITLRTVLERLPEMGLDPDASLPVVHGIFSRSADSVEVVVAA